MAEAILNYFTGMSYIVPYKVFYIFSGKPFKKTTRPIQ
jgi:hypothetical protein